MSENRCEFCKSTWDTSNVLTECPFCGKTILIGDDSDDRINQSIERLLLKMRNTYGISIFEKKQESISIMRDLAPNLDHDIRMFKIGLDANIYFEFNKVQKCTQRIEETKKRVHSILSEDFFLNDKSINTIICWFSSLFEIELNNKRENMQISNNEKKQLVTVLKQVEEVKKQEGSFQNAKSSPDVKKIEARTSEIASNNVVELYDVNRNRIYEGYVRDGKRNGHGISYYSSGKKEYEGEWSLDLKSGFGILYDEGGTIIYRGDWLNGYRSGRGELFSSNGVYAGGFAKNQKDGRGVMKYNDGTSEQQDWYIGTRKYDKGFIKKIQSLYLDPDNEYLERNFEPLLKLAEDGNGDAQFYVGKCYFNGIGTDKDSNNSERWYQKAAKQNNSCAMHNLGQIYETNKKFKEAVDYYKEALFLGEVLSAYNIGLVLIRTRDEKDYTERLKFAEKIIEYGNNIEKPNKYTSQLMFLKYKYECAKLGIRITAKIIETYEKPLKIFVGQEAKNMISIYHEKTEIYNSAMETIKKRFLEEYNKDVDKVEW